MWRVFLAISIGCLAACGATSFGVVDDGRFPARPPGSDYLDWEHLCVVFDEQSGTEVLNDATANGWELVTLGKQGNDDLLCFKRPKPAGGMQ